MMSNPEADFGELSGKLYNYLLDLQFGVIKEPHPWITSLDI